MKKTILLGFILSLCYTSLKTQDLHIYYDAQMDSLSYKYGGQFIKSPKVKRGGNIILHLENYNNYLYDAEIKATSRNITIPSGGSPTEISNLFGGEGATGSSPFSWLSNISGSRGGLGVGSGEIDDFGVSGMAAGQALAQAQKFSERYSTAKAQLEATEKKISTIRTDLKKITEAQKVLAFGADEVRKLRYNPNLKPSQIKKLAQEYMETIFAVNNVQELNLEKVLKKAEPQEQFAGQLQSYEKEAKNYELQSNLLSIIQDSVALIQLNMQKFRNFKFAVNESINDTDQKLSGYQEEIENLKSVEIGRVDVQELAQLRYDYEALMENDFSHTYRAAAGKDKTTFNITLTPIDSAEITEAKTIQLAPIEIPVFGGLKVNTSIGISFGQFFNRPQSYFLRDSIIRSENTDSFVPILTSFFHFYGQSAGNVSFGGSFGVGIPLINGNDAQSVSFFLGPSLMIGNQDRIVLSAGIMGGKVDRLTEGFQAGDTFISSSNQVVTRSRYELGAYLGISFNLFANN